MVNPKAWFSRTDGADDSSGLSKGDGPVISESTSLLAAQRSVSEDEDEADSYGITTDGATADGDAEGMYKTSDSRRQIGVVSAVFLIFNRMIGTGIFATPSVILEMSGSVGLALIMWVAGMLVAAAGMAVYLEFGTGMPRNGGEKNYLEFVYRKPRFLTTGFYTGYVVLLGMFSEGEPWGYVRANNLQDGPVRTPSWRANTSSTQQTLKSTAGISVESVSRSSRSLSSCTVSR